MTTSPQAGTPQNTSLHHTNNANNIPSLSSSTTLEYFPKDKWGYNLPHKDNNYNPLPAIISDPTAGALIKEATEPTNRDVTNVRFATKISNSIIPGTYSNKVLYTAVANSVPEPPKTFDDAYAEAGKTRDEETGLYKMQEMNNSICSAVAEATDTTAAGTQMSTLVDTRDGKTYGVAKLKDGKCWMNQNLDLNLSTNTTLTSDNTNIAPNTTWTPSSTSFTDPSQWESFTHSDTAPRSLDIGEKYIFTAGNPETESVYTSLSACMSGTGLNADECKHHSTGNYYNWSAAKASNDTSSQQDPSTSNNYDICPKGWRLPNGNASAPSEFGTMLQEQHIIIYNDTYDTGGATNIRLTPLYWVRAGYISYGLHHDAGSLGLYWPSTARSDRYIYLANFSSSAITARSTALKYDRRHGLSVRCVASNTTNPQPTPDPTPANDANGDNGGTLRSAAPAASGTSTATEGTDDAAYSAPQGVRDTSLKHFISTGGPNWFLFILLLVLSVLTLGISLFIFWRKNRKENQIEAD